MRVLILAAVSIGAIACTKAAPPDGGDGSDIADVPVDIIPIVDATDAADVQPDAIVVESVPRQIAPLATSTVTSQRPTFRFVLSTDASQPHIEICTARSCDTIEQTIDASGNRATASAMLAPGLHYWRIHDGSRTTPAWPFYVRHRSSSVDTSSGTVPDFNGDGFADVIVGANHADDQAGRVDVFYGSSAGIPSTPQVQLHGSDANGHFGWSVASAGDVNGDGFGDALVGAADASNLDGRAYLFLGGPSGLAATPAATLTPSDSMGNFGTVVASIGDVDGDGYGDVAVGVPNANTTAGRAYIYRGGRNGLQAAGILEAPGGIGGEFGYSLGAAGDVNGDGFGDLVVGANSAAMSSGEAYLYFGGSAGLPTQPSQTLSSPTDPNGEFGAFVAGAGDVNGDGFSDVIVGATATMTGSAFVYHGSARGVASRPDSSLTGPDGLMSGFGWSVSTAGDVNGDGFDEVIVSATCAIFGADPDGGYPHCGAGRAYLYGGTSGGIASAPTMSLTGPVNEDAFGWAVGGAGDVDGDGYGDVFASAYAIDMFAGGAYLFHGGMTGLSPTPWFTLHGGTGSSDNYGWSIALLARPLRRHAG